MEGCVEGKNRLEEVDLLRGFGILLMVIGHIGFGDSYDVYIHGFHMPLWFVISGYFSDKKGDTKAYISKRAKGFLAPYFCFALFYELLFCLRGQQRWLSMLFPNRILMPFNESLWFLPAIFIANVFAFVVLKYLPSCFSGLVLAAAALIGSLHILKLPLCADSAMIGAGFFGIGFLLRKFGKNVLKLDLRLVLLLFAANAFLIFLNGYVNMRINEYGNIILFWLNAVLAVILYWNVFKRISLKLSLPILREIGANSLLYVCLNQFIIYIIHRLIGADNVYLLAGRKAIELFAVLVICFALNRVFEAVIFLNLTAKS